MLVFDNGQAAGRSRVLEVDPATGAIVWQYTADPPQALFSALAGGCERLADGTVLISDAQAGRAVEVTRDGRVVWAVQIRARRPSATASRCEIYRLSAVPHHATALLSAYRARQQALLEEWSIAAASPARDSATTLVRIAAALDAMRKGDRERAYALSHLGGVGFLPSYAFPTDTAALALTGHPAELGHDAVRALRDYAPGQLVYARGTKWLVDHVDFRRASLLSANGTAALPGRNLCLRCETVNDPTAATCLACDSDALLPLRTVPMRAMRARRRDRITADEEQRSRTPFDITTHLGAPGTTETWLFEHPGLALLWERGATVTMLNNGRRRRGAPGDREPFQVCDTCGQWWDTPATPAGRPTAAQRRTIDRHARYCPTGSPRNVVLTVDRPADCLQVLPDIEAAGVAAADLPVFLASARAAFDLGSRLVLEAGDGEVLGFDWPRPDPDDPARLTRLAVLYEDVPGGAGYLRQLAGRLGEVAEAIVPLLDGCACEKSCYACLRSYSNQMEAALLDRRVAAAFLRPHAGAPEVAPRALPSYADGFDGLPRSPIERRLAVALIEAGAPRGVTQHVLFDRRGADGVDRPGTIADFAWPGRRVAVFCDGWEHHGTPEQRAADGEKRAQARARGWTVLAFWGGQIVRDADACARQILAALR